MQRSSRASAVFVLSGGGSLGAVQVGMLRSLIEAGIRPTGVVGTSVGALNAAFLAGHDDLDGVQALTDLWMSIRRSDVFPVSVPSLVRAISRRSQFLSDSARLRNLILRAELGFERLEDAPIPLRVVAADLACGEPVVLERGDAVSALLASSAIPGIFPSVRFDNRELVDGAVAANTPIAQAEGLNPTEIYVLSTAPESHQRTPATAIGVMRRAIALSARQVERSALAAAADRRIVKVLPVPDLAGMVSGFDFGATRSLIDEAYELSVAWLRTAGPTGALRRLVSQPMTALPQGSLSEAVA
jgi:NTE family protein